MVSQPISFRASQAGSCPRRIQLEAWGTEGLPPWEGLERAFAEGNMHERDILEWAARNVDGGGWKIRAAQKPLVIHSDEDYALTGHIDGQLFAKGRGRYLLEAKALAKRGYQELVKLGVEAAHPQYYAQTQLYLHGLQQYPQSKTRTAYLVARDKETPRNRLWNHYVEKIPYDPDFVEILLSALRDLAAAIKSGEQIEPPYNPADDWRCRPPWCPYTYVCHPGYKRAAEGVKEAEELLPDVARRQEIGEMISELKEEYDALTEKIKSSLQDGEYHVGDWKVVLSTKQVERIDTKKVREQVDPLLLPGLITVSEQRGIRIVGLEEKG